VLQKLLSLGRRPVLNRSDDYILATFPPPARFFKHTNGLADTRRISENDLQVAAPGGSRFFCLHFPQQLFG
jgi:hypothetical protein